MQKCDLLYLNLSFIEQHYSEDISIEDISSFCGLNRSYFSKVFRDTMGESPQGVPAALPHGTGSTAADRKPPSHQHHQHHGQLSQSASLFPCVQKCIWHQPTGLSCKASCTIKIGLILHCTSFVFLTYKNAPFVRPNTVGQMGCCSFRGAPCFFIMIHHFPRAASGIRHQHGSGSDAAHPGIVPIFCAGMPCKLARKQCHFPAYCPILSA